MDLDTLLTYDHYGYALLALLGTGVAVGGIHWAVCKAAPSRQRLLSLRGVAPPFVNILGVLFGLTLAFLANDTWVSHDRAVTAVYREADALRSLAVLAGSIDAPQGDALRRNLGAYALALAEEWPRLAQRQTSPTVGPLGDELLRAVAAGAVNRAVGGTVQGLMLQRVTDLRNERDLRIGLSQTHINPLKWLGMAFLGLLTLISVAIIHVEQARACLTALWLFALAAAPTAAIVLVQGNPFLEPFAVPPTPIVGVARDLGQAL